MYIKTYWRGDNPFFINLKKNWMIFFLQYYILKECLLRNRSVEQGRCEADVIAIRCELPYSSTHESKRLLYPYGSMVGWTLDRVEGSYVLRMYYLVLHGSYMMHAVYNRQWVTYRNYVGILEFGLGLTPL